MRFPRRYHSVRIAQLFYSTGFWASRADHKRRTQVIGLMMPAITSPTVTPDNGHRPTKAVQALSAYDVGDRLDVGDLAAAVASRAFHSDRLARIPAAIREAVTVAASAISPGPLPRAKQSASLAQASRSARIAALMCDWADASVTVVS